MGFLDGSIGKESTCHAGDTGDVGSIPGSRRTPERGKCQPTPVFLSEKSYGQRSLVGYSPKGCKESDTTEWLCMHKHKSSVQFSSVHLLSCVWLFATPWTTVQYTRLPIHHQLPEFTQTHVHWINDAIQPSYPLSSPSPAFNLSQHQGLFEWVSS